MLSDMATGLAGSEILKIAADLRALSAQGKTICNLTVGDFSPTEFPIPKYLENSIIKHLQAGHTNYPPSDGVIELRKAVQGFYADWLGLQYPEKGILIAGGARPLIYSMYRAVVNPGDIVLYPTPSWNNNHYCYMLGAKGLAIPCKPENAFLPTVDILKPHIKTARLLSLNSPLNPTGTAFTRETLASICEMILDENKRRGPKDPLYIMYDQIYWMLTFGTTKHFHPIEIFPEMARYTLFIDGISKAFASTGVRVGWGLGPSAVIEKMSSILGHVGAWAPRAEQMATAELLNAKEEIIKYHATMKVGIQERLNVLHQGLIQLKNQNLPVHAMDPMGAIYLTAQFDFIGKKNPMGGQFETNEQVRQYLLNEAGLGIVPFQAFGHQGHTGWFRLSVGAVSSASIQTMFPRLKLAIEKIGQN